MQCVRRRETKTRPPLFKFWLTHCAPVCPCAAAKVESDKMSPPRTSLCRHDILASDKPGGVAWPDFVSVLAWVYYFLMGATPRSTRTSYPQRGRPHRGPPCPLRTCPDVNTGVEITKFTVLTCPSDKCHKNLLVRYVFHLSTSFI